MVGLQIFQCRCTTQPPASPVAPALTQLLTMLDATTVEAAVESLQHHFGKDAKIIDILLAKVDRG